MNNSVLNTDSFDRRHYEKVYEISGNLQKMNNSGRELLPNSPDLLGIFGQVFTK